MFGVMMSNCIVPVTIIRFSKTFARAISVLESRWVYVRLEQNAGKVEARVITAPSSPKL